MKQLIILITLCLLLVSGSALADVPASMNVQGRLTDSTGESLGERFMEFTFKIFDAEVGGTKIWPAGPGELHLDVYIDAGGLWNARVGELIPLTDSVFLDTARWLEVAVGDSANPAETLPRIKLNTNPYSYRAATSQQADLADNADLLDGLNSTDFAGIGHNHGAATIDDIYVFNTGDVINGTLTMSGSNPITLDPSTAGNGSVVLPDDAISASEILDEPGIAQGIIKGTNIGITLATMVDVVTVTITTPAFGYVFVEASGLTFFGATTARNTLDYQIDETAGGSADVAYALIAGGQFATAEFNYQSSSVRRTYLKSAGTYTFRLESSKAGSGVAFWWNPIITATYFSTSYGTVATAVPASEAGEFENATPVSMGENPLGENIFQSEQMYVVDLRELELKAARAEAEAEKAKRELLEAQLQHDHQGAVQTEPAVPGSQ